MFPLRDDIPSSRFPVVTVGIIVANVLVFLQEVQAGRHLQELFLNYAVIPVRYTQPEVAQYFTWAQQVFSFFSSMFLHGGWIHLLGNMWVLWIFGDNVEDRLGRTRYVMLYLASGVAAAVLHIFTNPNSEMPTVGASGAIAGIMGSYFRFYPQARVETIIPPFIFTVFRLPAIVFLGGWFLLQFFNGAMSLGARGQAGGVAWWAHVGGFMFGFVTCLFAQKEPRAPVPPRYIDV